MNPSGLKAFHSPLYILYIEGTIFLATETSNVKAKSAVALDSTSGVLLAGIPKAVAS